MKEEFRFWDKIDEEFEKQFPKGKCKERGNALVLNAIFHIQFEEFIKRLKKEIKSEVLLCNCEIAEDRAEEIINNLSGDLK